MAAINRSLILVIGFARAFIGRHSMNSCWVAALILSCLFSLALAETKSVAPLAPKPAAPKSQASCPSLEFGKFIAIFSENVAVQRRYTRFPLEYRYIDLSLIGTKREAEAFKKRSFKSFEEVPFRSRINKKVVSLIANSSERKRFRLKMKIDQKESGETKSTSLCFCQNPMTSRFIIFSEIGLVGILSLSTASRFKGMTVL